MFRTGGIAVLAMLALHTAASAQGVSGTILIKKRLSRRSVTAAIPVYQRGPSVELGKDAEEDPLAYEKSRVVLYLEAAGTAKDAAKPASAEVQQVDRRFAPDLLVVPLGSTVSFPNMDPIFHNIYSLSKAKSFDLGSYDKGQTRKVTFPKPGIVEVYCHLHPNMAATIVVAPTRWYAMADRNGHYDIPDVPPGRYTVVAWHRSAGFFRKAINVEDGHAATADFFIPLDADPKQQPPAATDTRGGAASR
jgi:plastocyanin